MSFPSLFLLLCDFSLDLLNSFSLLCPAQPIKSFAISLREHLLPYSQSTHRTYPAIFYSSCFYCYYFCQNNTINLNHYYRISKNFEKENSLENCSFAQSFYLHSFEFPIPLFFPFYNSLSVAIFLKYVKFFFDFIS